VIRDNQDYERPERYTPSRDDWGSRILRRLPTPQWTTRQTNLPLLANPGQLVRDWRISFGGTATRAMQTFAFETRPGSTIQYIGVVMPANERPRAWLIYFRHTAQAKDFHGDLLAMGAGDYLVGRMQVSQQLSASGKSVAVIIPVAIGSSGEFAGNENFVMRCLEEIETSIFGAATNPPLLAASNSDGIFELQKYLRGCPRLRARTKGIYDFDGSFRIGTDGITLAVAGARVFRYDGAHSAMHGKDETDEGFLGRTMAANPARIPLALSRWRSHPRFPAVRPLDDPKVRHKKGDPEDAAHNMNDWNWLHHHIPTCMLQHGLASTPGI
jgi:hypothetical protein